MKIKVLPAFNGDCLLISFDYEGETKNILIDGGIPRTYQRHLKPELQNLINLGQNVDLLIVTHIDDDHIGGIKELYQDSGLDRSCIKNVWFNSGDLLSDYFNVEKIKERQVEIIVDEQTDMSLTQGITLEKILNQDGNAWLQKLIKVSPDTINFFGITITILSPNEEKLKRLHKKWEIETNTQVNMSDEHNDFNIPIFQLNSRKFIEDTSIPNGSSVALLLENCETRLLLLGDAHPSVVVSSLKDLGLATEENSLSVNLVKVAHHGSKGNTSPELLSLIRSEKFVISTDGTKHGLPNKEAIARIVATQPNSQLYFNYDEVAGDLFLPEDNERYTFEFNFLSEIDYTIEL